MGEREEIKRESKKREKQHAQQIQALSDQMEVVKKRRNHELKEINAAKERKLSKEINAAEERKLSTKPRLIQSFHLKKGAGSPRDGEYVWDFGAWMKEGEEIVYVTTAGRMKCKEFTWQKESPSKVQISVKTGRGQGL